MLLGSSASICAQTGSLVVDATLTIALADSVVMQIVVPQVAASLRYRLVVPAYNEESYIGGCLRSLDR